MTVCICVYVFGRNVQQSLENFQKIKKVLFSQPLSKELQGMATASWNVLFSALKIEVNNHRI